MEIIDSNTHLYHGTEKNQIPESGQVWFSDFRAAAGTFIGYSLLKGNIAARNTTTNTEVASFIINQAIAYRDTAGAAVLVGSPVPLTRLDSGGGATSWLADLASSGNNILLRVTGDSTDTVEWCADLEFVEVAG
jgi:hypothetical protein